MSEMPIRELAITYFKEELSLIKGADARKFAEYGLALVPEKFFYIPASSSGKYHPAYAGGIGGLTKHTKAAMLYAKELQPIYEFKPETWDNIYIALLFHDCGKPEWEHPLLAAEILRPLEVDFPDIYRKVCKLISSHMGQWNKPYKGSNLNIELPLPKSPAQKFVHLCDYLASRKSFEIEVR